MPVIIEETSEIAYVLGEADTAGLVLEDQDVAHVVAAHMAYFGAIGAVGPRARDPELGAN